MSQSLEVRGLYKALYPFKKTHPTSLGFKKDEIFLELLGAANDQNWYYVVASNGATGYIPKNYVMTERVTLDAFVNHVKLVKDRVKHSKTPDKEKNEVLANLEKILHSAATNGGKDLSQASVLSVSPSGSTQSDRSVSPRGQNSKKKAAAPKPPSAKNSAIANDTGGPSEPSPALPPKNSIKANQGEGSANNQIRKSSLTTTMELTKAQIKAHARDLVELVRVETGLSHPNSQSVVHSVLQYISTNLNRLDKNVPAILTELEFPVLTDLSDIACSSDTRVMEELFEQLTRCKEDDQQRNWMLYEDEQIISQNLKHLRDRLTSSDQRVSRYVLSKFKYFYVHNLVEYFQMEPRWSLRKLLIENFMIMCSLDPVIISLFLCSVLPLELAHDLYHHMDQMGRTRATSLLLTMVFSRGEPMPVHFYDQLGDKFTTFLLNYIEEPPPNDIDLEVPDLFVGLALSYNLQFHNIEANVLLNCLSRRNGAKVWTEKILLLLNRQEDPCAMFMMNFSPAEVEENVAIAHSVQKMVMDMYSHPTCHNHFYTNDVYVLIDIIVRQLVDLGPEVQARHSFVRLCKLVLMNTDYTEHLHRFKDLEIIFMHILDDEDEHPEDKKVVEEICRDVHAFNTLAP